MVSVIAVDKNRRQVTHIDASVPDGSSQPNDIQIVNTDPSWAGTAVINVKLSDPTATGTLWVWLFDGTLGWAVSEKFVLPPAGYTADFVIPLVSNISGQTFGVTVPTLSTGTIKITAMAQSRRTGGNF